MVMLVLNDVVRKQVKMCLEDSESLLCCRRRNFNLLIKSSWSSQGRFERLRMVCTSQKKGPGVLAVGACQQSRHDFPIGSTHYVNLIKEQDSFFATHRPCG